MNNLEWAAFDAGMVIVKCTTVRACHTFLQACEDKGLKFQSGTEPTLTVFRDCAVMPKYFMCRQSGRMRFASLESCAG